MEIIAEDGYLVIVTEKTKFYYKSCKKVDMVTGVETIEGKRDEIIKSKAKYVL